MLFQLGLHVSQAQRQQHLPAFKHQPVKARQQAPKLRIELLCQQL